MIVWCGLGLDDIVVSGGFVLDDVGLVVDDVILSGGIVLDDVILSGSLGLDVARFGGFLLDVARFDVARFGGFLLDVTRFGGFLLNVTLFGFGGFVLDDVIVSGGFVLVFLDDRVHRAMESLSSSLVAGV